MQYQEIKEVVNRKGEVEAFDNENIFNKISRLAKVSPRLSVNVNKLTAEICSMVKERITTSEIDELAAKTSMLNALDNIDYGKLAARITIDNHQKNTLGSFVDKMKLMYDFKDEKGWCPKVSKEFYDYVILNRDFLEELIDYKRDFLFDYFGFKTYQNNFSLKLNGKCVERMQDTFLRVCVNLGMYYYTNVQMHQRRNDEDDVFIKKEYDYIKENYLYLSGKFYSLSSPCYYNSGTNKSQLASCFLLGVEDSTESIMNTAKDTALISKSAGGVAINIQSIRSTGVRIKGTNGVSQGPLKFVPIYESIGQGFNQGSKRPGSIVLTYSVWHPDILELLDLKLTSGGIGSQGIDSKITRARGLYYCVSIPDLFIKKLREKDKKKRMWCLIDPHLHFDLSKIYGEEFEMKYNELESKGMYVRKIDPIDIMSHIYESKINNGGPWLYFTDSVNKVNMQNNIGCITGTNLCSEIVEYTSESCSSVCTLSSICLGNFVEKSGESKSFFNFTELNKVVRLCVRNLNRMIDINWYPTEKTKHTNFKHRPIGLGVQGLQDVYFKMGIAYDSDEASELTKKIFEMIYFSSLNASCDLSREIWIKLKEHGGKIWKYDECEYNERDVEKSYLGREYEFKKGDEIDSKIGSYDALTWGKGGNIMEKFHWQFYLSDDEVWLKEDWKTLRNKINKFGVRNSLCIALMPTASSSILMNNVSSIECLTSNLYKAETVSGSFQRINNYLIEDLYKLGIWNNELKEKIIKSEGSIQEIEEIPGKIKEIYRTVYDYDQGVIIKRMAEIQPFVDQSISLNLFYGELSADKFIKDVFMIHKYGLKTQYYVRTKPAVNALNVNVKDKVKVKVKGTDESVCIGCSL